MLFTFREHSLYNKTCLENVKFNYFHVNGHPINVCYYKEQCNEHF